MSRERLPQNIFTLTRARKSSIFSHFFYVIVAPNTIILIIIGLSNPCSYSLLALTAKEIPQSKQEVSKGGKRERCERGLRN